MRKKKLKRSKLILILLTRNLRIKKKNLNQAHLLSLDRKVNKKIKTNNNSKYPKTSNLGLPLPHLCWMNLKMNSQMTLKNRG